MLKNFAIMLLFSMIAMSCVSNKKYAAMQDEKANTTVLLEKEMKTSATYKEQRDDARRKVEYLEKTNSDLRSQLAEIKDEKGVLLKNMGNLTTLSKKGAESLNTSLKSIKEKDMRIQNLQDAITKRDSVTLALVTSLKGAIGNINDKDIEISVDKGVVFISISDKLLFESGSYRVNDKAEPVLQKIAKVVNNKPNLEFMVEGHTDNVPINKPGIEDNWDLSVHRATSVVRLLQDKFGVAPERMTAAGRSYYVPVVENTSAENKARNRRTRIVVLPELDQFYDLVDEGMKEAEKNSRDGK